MTANIKSQSAGGKAKAIISKQEAAQRKAEYDLNPNKCEWCDKAILSLPDKRLSEIKIKKFCSASCSAKKRNHEYRRIRGPRVYKCRNCKETQVEKRGRLCEECYVKRFLSSDTTKKDLFEMYPYQRAHVSIRTHARRVYQASNKVQCCSICSYDLHYQVAHRKAVADFPEEAYLKEINHPDNLIALCPNHHWEFDHGALDA